MKSQDGRFEKRRGFKLRENGIGKRIGEVTGKQIINWEGGIGKNDG